MEENLDKNNEVHKEISDINTKSNSEKKKEPNLEKDVNYSNTDKDDWDNADNDW